MVCGLVRWFYFKPFLFTVKKAASDIAMLASTSYKALCKYWIFIVVAFHIAIATEGKPNGIKIIYMFLLVVFVTSFVVSNH